MAIDPAEVVLIGDLPPIAIPLNDYLIPVFRNGQTSYMSVAQILSLFVAGTYTAADIAFVPGSGIVATDVQGAIAEAISDLTTLIGQRAVLADGTLILAKAGVEAVQRTWTAAMLRAAAIAAGGGAPDAVLEDQKASGTGAGTFTAGSWQVRTLNTEVKDTFGLITLSGSQFTPTVDGWCSWSAPAAVVDNNQTRLFNITDGTVAGYGASEHASNGGIGFSNSEGGAPVLAGKTYRLEHRCQTTNSVGLGRAMGFGNIEVYARVEFWRAG